MLTHKNGTLVLITCIAAMFSGCFVDAVIDMQATPPVRECMYSYSYNNEQEAAVGKAMVYKIDGRVAAGFVAVSSYQPEPEQDGKLRFAVIEEGSQWAIVGRTKQGDYICGNDAYPRPMLEAERVLWHFCLVVNKAGEPYGYNRCTEDDVLIFAWPVTPKNFLERKNKVFVKGSFKQEFVYNGRSKDIVRLTYNEYADGLPQPVFSRDLSFSLAESRVVGFKGMKMEVLEATDTRIRFYVRAPFD